MKRICMDFDGVIHSYTEGWTGDDDIPSPPVDGIKDFINLLRTSGYEVVVNSTRCRSSSGYFAVHEYLNKHGIKVDSVVKDKPPAFIYIDDRALKFNPLDYLGMLKEIREFKTWQGK